LENKDARARYGILKGTRRHRRPAWKRRALCTRERSLKTEQRQSDAPGSRLGGLRL
jgi:hypothetical protein